MADLVENVRLAAREMQQFTAPFAAFASESTVPAHRECPAKRASSGASVSPAVAPGTPLSLSPAACSERLSPVSVRRESVSETSSAASSPRMERFAGRQQPTADDSLTSMDFLSMHVSGLRLPAMGNGTASALASGGAKPAARSRPRRSAKGKASEKKARRSSTSSSTKNETDASSGSGAAAGGAEATRTPKLRVTPVDLELAEKAVQAGHVIPEHPSEADYATNPYCRPRYTNVSLIIRCMHMHAYEPISLETIYHTLKKTYAFYDRDIANTLRSRETVEVVKAEASPPQQQPQPQEQDVRNDDAEGDGWKGSAAPGGCGVATATALSGGRKKKSSWTNTVRHALSMEKFFTAVQRPAGSKGRGGLWRVDLDAVPPQKLEVCRLDDLTVDMERQRERLAAEAEAAAAAASAADKEGAIASQCLDDNTEHGSSAHSHAAGALPHSDDLPGTPLSAATPADAERSTISSMSVCPYCSCCEANANGGGEMKMETEGEPPPPPAEGTDSARKPATARSRKRKKANGDEPAPKRKRAEKSGQTTTKRRPRQPRKRKADIAAAAAAAGNAHPDNINDTLGLLPSLDLPGGETDLLGVSGNTEFFARCLQEELGSELAQQQQQQQQHHAAVMMAGSQDGLNFSQSFGFAIKSGPFMGCQNPSLSATGLNFSAFQLAVAQQTAATDGLPTPITPSARRPMEPFPPFTSLVPCTPHGALDALSTPIKTESGLEEHAALSWSAALAQVTPHSLSAANVVAVDNWESAPPETLLAVAGSLGAFEPNSSFNEDRMKVLLAGAGGTGGDGGTECSAAVGTSSLSPPAGPAERRTATARSGTPTTPTVSAAGNPSASSAAAAAMAASTGRITLPVPDSGASLSRMQTPSPLSTLSFTAGATSTPLTSRPASPSPEAPFKQQPRPKQQQQQQEQQQQLPNSLDNDQLHGLVAHVPQGNSPRSTNSAPGLVSHFTFPSAHHHQQQHLSAHPVTYSPILSMHSQHQPISSPGYASAANVMATGKHELTLGHPLLTPPATAGMLSHHTASSPHHRQQYHGMQFLPLC